MFPLFEPIDGFIIYTFGLSLAVCFFLFIWMLNKLSVKLGFDYIIFKKNVLWYFLSVFFFSRLFYVVGKWHDLKYIKNPFEFFVMNDYNFSLAGAIIGFFVVLFITIKIRKEKLNNFIDGVIISFLFILIFGFLGALMGGQVYGIETLYGIEISYTHPFTPIPYQVPIFPLPIVYSIIFFVLFSISYISMMYIHIKGIIGYVGLISIGSVFLIFDYFSGKYDIFKDTIGINLMQTFSIFLIIFGGYRLFMLMKSNENKTILN
ncbi:MAG: prolipoprotein diacylglyceryl transferase [Candidatus Gracilibacteria bacterium]|nr:prolipoprotein diacylglyceryl transferase [Candidatus Gracilibacteria bacterium]